MRSTHLSRSVNIESATTLSTRSRFDANGLWSFRSVWFSPCGTLVETLESLVHNSTQGYFAGELQQILHVEVKDALLQLVRQRRLVRQQVAGLYLYCSRDSSVPRRQVMARQAFSEFPGSASAEVSAEELKASIVLFCSVLDEKQHRLYAGLESIEWSRRRPETGRVAATGSAYGGARPSATIGAASGLGGGPQTRRGPQAGGKKTPDVVG